MSEFASRSGWIIAAAAALSLTACGPGTTRVTASILVDKGANPSPDANANPVVVRLDLLRSADAYNGASFAQLYPSGKAVLTADLVSSNELELRPGDTRTVQVDDAKDAAVLAVLAAFRNIDAASWRATWDLDKGSNNKVTVRIGIGSVEVTRTRGGWF